MDKLLKSLDNDNNAQILQLSHSKIKNEKNDILQQLNFTRTVLKEIHIKLDNYRYIMDADSLCNGSYIRWINLQKLTTSTNSKILTNGAIICDWKIHDNGISVVCKTNMGHIIQIKFDETLIFQKLTEQEHIILSVVDYIHN
jgi:hypothetical protein